MLLSLYRLSPEGNYVSAGIYCESVTVPTPPHVILGQCYPSGWILIPRYPDEADGTNLHPKPDTSSDTPSAELREWTMNAPEILFRYTTSAELNGSLPHWLIDKFYSGTLIQFFHICEETFTKAAKDGIP